MKIKERVLGGELPSAIVFDLLKAGASWQEASDAFAGEFPEVESIISSLRKLSSGFYNKDPRNVDTLNYLILSDLRIAGFPVKVPSEPG